MGRLKDFVRRGGSLIVMDDSRIGERGSAKDFLKQFDVSITYHGPGAEQAVQKPHVHVSGMDLIKTPSADTFATRKIYEQGQLVYLWDAKDYSREGLGALLCPTVEGREGPVRYDLLALPRYFARGPERSRVLRGALSERCQDERQRPVGGRTPSPRVRE